MFSLQSLSPSHSNPFKVTVSNRTFAVLINHFTTRLQPICNRVVRIFQSFFVVQREKHLLTSESMRKVHRIRGSYRDIFSTDNFAFLLLVYPLDTPYDDSRGLPFRGRPKRLKVFVLRSGWVRSEDVELYSLERELYWEEVGGVRRCL